MLRKARKMLQNSEKCPIDKTLWLNPNKQGSRNELLNNYQNEIVKSSSMSTGTRCELRQLQPIMQNA